MPPVPRRAARRSLFCLALTCSSWGLTTVLPSSAAKSARYPGCLADLDLPRQDKLQPGSKRALRRAALLDKRGPRTPHALPAKPSARSLERFRLEQEAFRERARDQPLLCLDCEWEEAMSEKELRHCAQGLAACHGANRRAERPFQLWLSGMGFAPEMRRQLAAQIGFRATWQILEGPYIKKFPKERLIYLTPEGEEVADRFEDKNAIYVLGGLNDSSSVRLRGRSRKKADLQGIRTLRLPLEGILRADNALTVNQVLAMMLDRRAGRSWREAMDSHVPKRKLERGRRMADAIKRCRPQERQHQRTVPAGRLQRFWDALRRQFSSKR